MSSDSGERDLISIGELAQRTGISTDTLRVWERRYGEPIPVRLPSGHRRYTEEHVSRLRRVAEALAHGVRPSQIVGQPAEALEHLLEEHSPQVADDPVLETLLGFVEAYERAPLERELMALWQRFPAEQWLMRFVAPLVSTVGRRWAEGQIDIRQEHFMSEVLEDLLRMLRLEILSDQIDAEGAPMVLATLPEERHRLGLLMVALLCAVHQTPVRLIGADTPVSEIVGAVHDCDAKAVALSVSLASGGPQTDKTLRELRELLPREVTVLVGGTGARGARRRRAGLLYLDSLAAFTKWLEQRSS